MKTSGQIFGARFVQSNFIRLCSTNIKGHAGDSSPAHIPILALDYPPEEYFSRGHVTLPQALPAAGKGVAAALRRHMRHALIEAVAT